MNIEARPNIKLIIDKILKNELRRWLPQPAGKLSINATPSQLDWEQSDELPVIPTEVSSTYNPKTMALIKELCKDAEPE